MSDYTPTLEVIRDAVTFPRERLGEPRPISGEAFDRFIAHVKADALREWAALLDLSNFTPAPAYRYAEVARRRAHQIVKEAGE